MSIRRIGITSEYGPRMSRGVIHNGMLLLSGVVAADFTAGTEAQTREVLARIDDLLAEAGTTRENVLTAHIWLFDMSEFQSMNAAWNDWADPKAPPARTCVSGELYRPDCRVEIAVTAVVPE